MIDPADSQDNSHLFVLILAGGDGSRIGGAKPQRELGGMRLIDRAVLQARSFGGQIAIALREQGQIETNLPCITDAAGLRGPLAGLSAGLARAEEAGRQHLLLLPTDMPFLPADLLDNLSRALADNSEAKVALAESNARIHPVCSLWRTDIGDAVSDYVETGRLSLIGLAEHVGFVSVCWDGFPDPFSNVNTQADLEAARLRLES